MYSVTSVFVVRERTSLARDFEKHGGSYGPIDFTGVASTFENAEGVIGNSLFALDLNPELPDLNWTQVGYGDWKCTTTDGTYVTEWWINSAHVQTKPHIKEARTRMNWKPRGA